MNLNKIEVVGEHKHFQIREITDSGGYHRRVLTSDMDVSSEVQEIKDKAELEWTDEVKASWTKFQAEQEAKMEGGSNEGEQFGQSNFKG